MFRDPLVGRECHHAARADHERTDTLMGKCTPIYREYLTPITRFFQILKTCRFVRSSNPMHMTADKSCFRLQVTQRSFTQRTIQKQCYSIFATDDDKNVRFATDIPIFENWISVDRLNDFKFRVNHP